MFTQMLMSRQSIFVSSIIISANATDWNLITDGLGGVTPDVPAQITITVEAGVLIDATIGVAAMDLTGLPAESTILLTNNGDIIGKGGGGGNGQRGIMFSLNGLPCTFNGTPASTSGGAGWSAIKVDGTNVDLDIENLNGNVYGGGGGGGGGNANGQASQCDIAGGAAGGGGAGGGSAGAPGQAQNDGTGCARVGTSGTAGTSGASGTGGLGGAGSSACRTTSAGGNGGEYGANGATAAKVGGVAGKAVRRDSGGGTTTFLSGGGASQVKGAVE
jgi:hypothetical protein